MSVTQRATVGNPAAEAENFLRALFGDSLAPDSPYLLALWCNPSKRTDWCQTIEQAVQYALLRRETQDVYVSCGLRRKRSYGRSERGTAEDVIAIPGVWLDIDIAGPGHSDKKKYCPDIDTALEILATCKISPTLVVRTGGGIQAWWLLHELYVAGEDGSPEEMEALCQRWTKFVQNLFKWRGWAVDSTQDLARVLRLPGTYNRKIEDNPRPVTIHAYDPYRLWTPDELGNLCRDTVIPQAISQANENEQRERVLGENLIYDPAASYNSAKFEALRLVEPSFEPLWNRRKKVADDSPSGYDWALCRVAMQYGWTDQEIVDLLIHHRRQHGLDVKLRDSYFVTTLSRMRARLAQEDTWDKLTEVAVLDQVPDDLREEVGVQKSEPAQEKREVTLRFVSEALEIEIHRIVKYVAGTPTYKLVTNQGEMTLGDVSCITSQEKFRNKIAGLTGKMIVRRKIQDWDEISQLILHACEIEETGKESTDEGEVQQWLDLYLAEKQVSRLDEGIGLNETIVGNLQPFRNGDGRVRIFTAGLKKFLTETLKESVTFQQLGPRLRGFGAEHEGNYPALLDGRETSRAVWRLPEQF